MPLALIKDDMAADAAANIPKWMVSGGWFDVCNCNIPCPCEFAQTPTFGDCDADLYTIFIKDNTAKEHL